MRLSMWQTFLRATPFAIALTATSAARAESTGSISSYWQGQGSIEHVFYVDTGGYAFELYHDSGGWHVGGGGQWTWGAGASISGLFDGTTQQVFVQVGGPSNILHKWCNSSGCWGEENLTTETNSPYEYYKLDPNYGEIVGTGGLVSLWDGTVLHAYFVSPDFHLRELYWNGSWWGNDLAQNVAPGLQQAGSLAAYWDGSTQNIFYVGQDEHVHVANSGGGWHTTDVSVASGATQTGNLPCWTVPYTTYVTAPLTGLFNRGSQMVFYSDCNRHINWIVGNGTWWSSIDLNTTTGVTGSSYFADGPVTSYVDLANVIHVFYVALDGHVHEFYFDGGWHANDVTNAAGAIGAMNTQSLFGSSPLTSFVEPSYEHVFYVGSDGHVHELYHATAGQWHTTDVSASAGVTAYPAM